MKTMRIASRDAIIVIVLALAVCLAACSDYSDTTGPTDPANLSAASPISSEVQLAWKASEDIIDWTSSSDDTRLSYRVFRDGELIGSIEDTEYSDFDVSIGTTYCYSIMAFDGGDNESDETAPACATVPAFGEKTLGGELDDIAYSIAISNSGDYYIGGYTFALEGAGANDAYILKVSDDGDVQWEKTFGGSDADTVSSVLALPDGGVIAAGSTKSSGAGLSDIYVLKADSSGDLIWEKTFGGSIDETGHSISATSDGGFIIAGYTESSGSGGGDAYLLKIDSSGETLWERTFGGSKRDSFAAVVETSDGGFVSAGYKGADYSDGSEESDTSADLYVVRTDSSGNLVWEMTFGGSDRDSGRSLIETSDGGYGVTGVTVSDSEGDSDIYLLKIDARGNLLWETTLGGDGDDQGNEIFETSSGDFIIVGSTDSSGAGLSDAYVVRTDSGGSALWDKTYGGDGDDIGRAGVERPGGGFMFTGQTRSYGKGGDNIYLIRTDESGD